MSGYLAEARAEVPEYLLLANQQASDDNIALFQAAAEGNDAEVLRLIQRGAKPNFFFRPEDQKNALHIAAEKNHLNVVRVLLENGAVVDAIATSSQSTALIFAALNDNAEMIKVLLGAGANIDAVNCFGNGALHEACRLGHYSVASALLQAGAQPNAVNHKGSTALHMLCYGTDPAKHSVKLAQLLVGEYKASVDGRDLQQGLTPLLVCCSTGRLDLLNYLIDMGANAEAKDLNGKGAEQIATFYNHADLLPHMKASRR